MPFVWKLASIEPFLRLKIPKNVYDLDGAERVQLQLRRRAGETHEVAATALGCSAKSVQRSLVKTGGVKPRSPPPSAWRRSLPEREEIARGLLAGDSCRVIARRLGRSPSTVSRDVNAVAESFFATLALELVHAAAWNTRAAARRALFEYLEPFSNGRPRHAALGYLSPRAVEQQWQDETLAS